MAQLWHKVSDYIYRKFRLLWFLITLSALLICSYITWNSNIQNAYGSISTTAHRLAHNVDAFINSVFSDTINLPLYEKAHLNCKDDLAPYLAHIVINNPLISSLAIRDVNHQIICSTLPDTKTIIIEDPKLTQSLSGPVTNPAFDHPVYFIYKKIGYYYIEITIVSSVLKNLLHVPDPDIKEVILSDKNKNIDLLTVKNKTRESRLNKKIVGEVPETEENQIVATANLLSLKGITVTVVESRQVLFNNIWHNQLIRGLTVLIISIFLYFLLKSILERRYSLQWAIKKAIKKKQFYPVYQPLYNTQTNKYSGAEALLRWQGSHDEIIMPDFFIEEAEDTGLILPITLQIIEIAFKEVSSVLHDDPEFHLSFNICALHFTDLTFFDKFYKLLTNYSISPRQILFEITERDLLDKDNEIYINKMHELRDKGFSLAIDDYGTGHSSISYLQYYPFNYLKIDKLFIHAIGTKAITESLNDAIIDLAKKMNLIVIAEGVETKERADYLLKNGIQLLQGWYYSRALSIQQLKTLLQGEEK